MNAWLALLVAASVTAGIRLGGVALARHPVFRKMDADTLGRRFPLIILFVLLFKEVVGGSPQEALARACAIGVVGALHLWKRSFFLSIAGGTLFYVLWVNA